MNREIEIMEHADRETAVGEAEFSSDVKAKIAGIRDLGELVRGRLELAADDVSDARFATLWRSIDQRLGGDAGEVSGQPAELHGGFWHGVGRFFDRYRAHVLVGAVSAGAVAALALTLRPPREAGRSLGGGPIQARPVSHRPAEIDDLNTPGGVGTVFYLDDEDGSTTVIWVTPQDTVEGI